MTKANGKSPDGWIIDLNGVKGKERKQFVADIEAAVTGNSDDALLPWLARVVKRWPYNDVGKPDDVASYGELGLVQLAEVSKRFWIAFREFQEAFFPAPASGSPDGEGDTARTPEGADSSGLG